MTTTPGSTDEQNALVPMWEELPETPLVSDGLHFETIAHPQTRWITGWWANRKRRQNARRLGDEIYPEIQKAFQEALLEHHRLALDLRLEMIAGQNSFQLELAHALANDIIVRDQAQRMIARRIEIVRQLLEIQRTLRQLGVPDETLERKIGQHVERLIDTLGTELTTGGKNGPAE